MCVYASIAVALAATPVLTVVCLLAMMAVLMNRRGALIERVQDAVNKEHAKTIRQEQEAEQAFLENLLSGRSVPESLAHFLKTREALLPGMVPERPGYWDSDDLERVFQSQTGVSTESINRQLAFQASLAGATLIAVCVVVMSVLYAVQPAHDAARPFEPGATLPAMSPPSFPDDFGDFVPLSPETLTPKSPVGSPTDSAPSKANENSSPPPMDDSNRGPMTSNLTTHYLRVSTNANI